MREPDVAVVGGGIIGLACAHALAGRGLRVELIERDRCGGGASSAAAGMLAPLAEAPAAGLFFDVCRKARDLWPELVAELEAETGLFVDYDRIGALVLDLDGSDRGNRLIAAAERLGEPWARLRDGDLRAQIPDLAADIEQALLLPGEHRVDNRLVCRALVRACRERGVTVVEGQTIREVVPAERHVELRGPGWSRSPARVLIAAGAWSGALVGLPLAAIRPVRGEMLRLRGCNWPWRGTVHGTEHYAVRRTGDVLLIGSTTSNSGFETHITPAGQRSLLDFVLSVFPGLGDAVIERSWAGLRPGTADDRPILGPTEHANVWLATGHYRNGILLAPWTAERIADAMAADDSSRLPEAFSPRRFDPTDQAGGPSPTTPSASLPSAAADDLSSA